MLLWHRHHFHIKRIQIKLVWNVAGTRGRQNTSGWTLPHLSKYIATASHQINCWMAYPGILHTGIFLEVVGDKILVFDGNQKVCSFPSIFSSTTRTWCMTAQACSSEMGAEKEWRIWSRLRQSAGSSRAPRQPVSRSMSRGVTRCHEWSLCCLSSPLITSHP